MKRMGTLRRFLKDMAILLQYALENNDFTLVAEVTQNINIVQNGMEGGKKWPEVELSHVHLLLAVRQEVKAIEAAATTAIEAVEEGV